IESGLVGGAVADVRGRVVAVTNALQQRLVVDKNGIEAAVDQAAQGGDGEVRLADAGRTLKQDALRAGGGVLRGEVAHGKHGGRKLVVVVRIAWQTAGEIIEAGTAEAVGNAGLDETIAD